MPLPQFRLHWLLPASLTLNVFLGAALVAHLRSDWFHHSPPPPPGNMLDQLTRELPPDDAQILRQSLAASLAEINRARQAEEELPERLRAILGREPFDQATFQHLLKQSQQAREILNDALPAAIAKLSPEGRRRLAAWQPEGPPPGMRDGPPRGPRPPDGPPPSPFLPSGPPPPR